jgi:predicted lipase
LGAEQARRRLPQAAFPAFSHAGHSLGGALAALAAPEIQRQHPRSRLSVYLYGCPKVGQLPGTCQEAAVR